MYRISPILQGLLLSFTTHKLIILLALGISVHKLINEEIVVNKKFAEMMYPIYTKHFTTDELKEIIEFNDTPIGRKVIKTRPLITQEAIQAGQAFSQTLWPKLQSRLAARLEKEGINWRLGLRKSE